MTLSGAFRSSNLLICSIYSCRSDKPSNGDNLPLILLIASSVPGQLRVLVTAAPKRPFGDVGS
jgi:hypothetical protein